jgi:hypothetical protein
MSMEGRPGMVRNQNQSIFGTVSVLADESAHVKLVKEPYFCTILERLAKAKT